MTDINFFEHKFNDYASLETSLHAWQTTNFVQLVKRNCPKVKLNADKSNSRELSYRVYESLYYQCIHYGEPRANYRHRPSIIQGQISKLSRLDLSRLDFSRLKSSRLNGEKSAKCEKKYFLIIFIFIRI
jgi:hypothetical protein